MRLGVAFGFFELLGLRPSVNLLAQQSATKAQLL